ncbi:hypothetical protein BOX15_Mlig014042g1, partial [Macrostomum lignano]
ADHSERRHSIGARASSSTGSRGRKRCCRHSSSDEAEPAAANPAHAAAAASATASTAANFKGGGGGSKRTRLQQHRDDVNIGATETAWTADREDVGTAGQAMPNAANSSSGSLNTVDDFVMAPAIAGGASASAAALSSVDAGVTGGVTTRSRIRESAALALVEELRLRPKSFEHLPPEVYCRILQYLSIVELMRVTSVNRQFHAAVTKHLRLAKRINFCSGLPFTFLSESLDDLTLASVLSLCPEVTHILGFYPRRILHRAPQQPQQQGATAAANSQAASSASSSVGASRTNRFLTYGGILQALKQCKKLKSIEIMDVDLMSRLIASFPRVKFHGMFRNRPDIWDCERAYEGPSPLPSSATKLLLSPQINSLTKVDLQTVCLNTLPKMDCVRYLYLKWVRFASNDPFVNFSAPKLQTFVMNNCAGPSNAFRYLRVFTALAKAPQLARLELTGLRFITGLIEHIVDEIGVDSRAFRALQKLSLSSNRSASEIDAGCLLLASSAGLSCASLQSSLCKDSLFVSLTCAQAQFPKLDTLTLGYKDPCPDLDRSQFTVEPTDPPCQLTDYGMTYVGRCFNRLTNLTVCRAPFLADPTRWLDQPLLLFEPLRCLTLEACQCMVAGRLTDFMAQLPNIEMLVLRDMFAPAPRGCDYLGVAAGQRWSIMPHSCVTRDSVQGLFVANPPAGRMLAAFPSIRHRLFGCGADESQSQADAGAVGPNASASSSNASADGGAGEAQFYSRGVQTSVNSPNSPASSHHDAAAHQRRGDAVWSDFSSFSSHYRLRSRGNISDDQPEFELPSEPQRDCWFVRDVCLDTHDLRLYQPVPQSPFALRSAMLHAVHLERCGLTLIDCTESPRLRTLTLESCPRLAEIRLPAGSARGLRRLRIVGCPSFDYAQFYQDLVDLMTTRCIEPREGSGDDSLAVCYRPMGRYEPLAERALLRLPGSHLLLTHDYMGPEARDSNLDRLQSHFHQIFRDIMHFSENLIRRDYVKESRPGDPATRANRFGRGQMLRFESGHSSDGHPWDLLTDIPWIGECGVNPFPSLPEDADQLYQSLVESHSVAYYKMACRGLFLHVQCRDIGKPARGSSKC